MSLIFEKEFKIPVQDFDFRNKLKLSALFNYLQDMAAEHAEIRGFGRADLEKYNLFWVLSWMKMEIKSYPVFGESIKIKTWPKTIYHLFAMRDFILYRENGEEFARATSAWMPVNSKLMKVTRFEHLPIDFSYNEKEIALDVLPSKIRPLKEKEGVFGKTIKYSDIDVNKHVNNQKYVEYMLDSFGQEDFEKAVNEITLSFLSEVKFGQKVELFRSISPKGNKISFELQNTTSNKAAFRAELIKE